MVEPKIASTCPNRRIFLVLERDHRFLIEGAERYGKQFPFWETVGFLLCQVAREEHEAACSTCQAELGVAA